MEEKSREDSDRAEPDDFFGDDEEEQPRTMAERELAALNERLTTLGYQDGVDDGAGEAVQEGFDGGYAMGAAAGWEAGLLYGGAAAAAAALAHVESLDRTHGGQTGESTEYGQKTTPPQSRPGKEGEGLSTATAEASVVRANPPRSRHTGSDDNEKPPVDKISAAVATAGSEDLGALVEELKRASLLGPDGPRVDRADVIRRLRRLGPAGVAVAGGLFP